MCCEYPLFPPFIGLKGYHFESGETIYPSIALGRRITDEPTNVYVKNLPSSWNNDKLRSVFGAFGQIRQSKVAGDGVGFVRFEKHKDALRAIDGMHRQIVAPGSKLEVRFATRRSSGGRRGVLRTKQVAQSTSNENNLYIDNVPRDFSQSSLERLFSRFGQISSAKINDNGIAFVRYDDLCALPLFTWRPLSFSSLSEVLCVFVLSVFDAFGLCHDRVL